MLVGILLLGLLSTLCGEQAEGFFNYPTTTTVASSGSISKETKMMISPSPSPSSSSSRTPAYGPVSPALPSSPYSLAELWHIGLPSLEMSKAGYLPDRCIITNADHILERSEAYFYQDGHKILDNDSRIVGIVVYIGEAEDQHKALALVGSVEWIVLRFEAGAWQMIPVENLVSATYTHENNPSFHESFLYHVCSRDRSRLVLGLGLNWQ